MFQPNCPGGLAAKGYLDYLHHAAVNRWIDVASELPTSYLERIVKDYDISTSTFRKLLISLDLAYSPPYIVAYHYTIERRRHKKYHFHRRY